MAADQFVLDARPPVRAFAVAAGLALLGAVLAVLPGAGGGRIALIVVGVLLIVGAGVLLGAAVLAGRRQRVTVSLDEVGFTVAGPDGERRGTWADVTKVTAAPGRLTLHQGEEQRVHLVASPGQGAPLDAIAAAISRRLDADRGYQIWQG